MASILAVDDEADIRMVIQTSLEMAGHDVTVSSNGEDALAKLKKRKFDLVILDIMMPEMDGYQVLEEIRAMPARADTAVIVVTAKHDPSGVMKEVAGGAVDHLAKPFLPSELEAVVERALSASDVELAERRRVLENEAQVYGSINDLYRDVQSNPDKN